MHKNIPLADLKLTKRSGNIIDVIKTYNIDHAPLTTIIQGRLDCLKLDSWFSGRSIPASRQNVGKLMRKLDITNPAALALQSFGLSLSDHYWIKPTNQDITWESINFFQNDFSDDIGKILMGEKDSSDPDINVKSPDNSSDGVLQKRWKIIDEKRMLIKGHNRDHQLQQEPFNEVIATQIMKELGIEHTAYEQIFIDNKPYSLCEIYTTKDLEYITAWSILNGFKRARELSEYEQLIKTCFELGVTNIRGQLEQMLTLDYLIANTDRHQRNFGVLRDANTLEYKSTVPIFDSGASLWCNGSPVSGIQLSKPFKARHSSQIKLVKDLSWYEPIPPQTLTDIIITTLSKNTPIKDIRMGLSSERIEKIAIAVNERAEFITKLKLELSPKIVPASISKQNSVNTSHST